MNWTFRRYPALGRLRRAVKRVPKKLRRLRQRIEKRVLALRHHRLWGEPRSLETAFAPKRRELPYPHFIIIGAPKCGTSWLQGTLGQHPNVVVVPNEIEYFSANLDRYPLDWYLDHFTQALASAPSGKVAPYVVGEKSARYCSLSPDRIRLVRNLLPDVRLILMTRDPVARHWSHAKRYFAKTRVAKREGGDGDVLSLPRQRLLEFLEETRALGEFSTIIDNWVSAFPGEQLLLVSQEQTVANPRATFDAVLEHIGLSTDYDPASIKFLSEQKNRGPSVKMPSDVAEYLETLFASERKRLRELFGDQGCVHAPNQRPPA